MWDMLQKHLKDSVIKECFDSRGDFKLHPLSVVMYH